VWFGESLPADAYRAAVEAAQTCGVFLSIGTSGVVEPASSLPRLAQRVRTTVVTINLDVKIESSPNMFYIRGKTGEVLPMLVKAVWG
jgi:NAD-dependent deacetylase